ncbi:MAG: carboxyl-terminal processing protease [Cellvibrionaceae bacterium]|jgi:carboxyl-terminal processing protease
MRLNIKPLHFIARSLMTILLSTFFIVLPSSAQQSPDSAPSETSVDASERVDNAPLPLKDLQLFTLIFDQIRRSYVEPISDQKLLENAIKGMLQELDPHSSYLDGSHFSSLKETTQGHFSGVGIEIGSENGYIKVITPIDETPAEKAGVEAGDLIIKLDGQSIRGFSISQAAKLMRGSKGSPITFTIVRKGRDKPFDITIIRDRIKTRSVRSKIIEDDFGYIRISQFQSNTGSEFADQINKLKQQNKELKGFVLDLRNNPGGVLQASVHVVDALIDKGTIVSTKGRLENNDQLFSATTGDASQGLPFVVLINGGSASAAEIVAGALQDHSRAIIMGTRSFGKGSVQTIFPVGKNKGIKLTTARYYTPSGRSIQAQGIVPDVIIERATITQINDDNRVKEADLAGHLSNGNEGEVEVGETKSKDDNIADNQLFEAINMLKGLAIFNNAKNNPHNQ